QLQGQPDADLEKLPLLGAVTLARRQRRGERDQHCGRPTGGCPRDDARLRPLMRGRAPRPVTRPQLRECPGCGLFQTVPALEPGMSAHSSRCPTILRRVSSHRGEHLVALAIAALTLLIVMSSTNLMSVEKAGIAHVAGLFSGPEELVRRNMAELAAVVIFVT